MKRINVAAFLLKSYVVVSILIMQNIWGQQKEDSIRHQNIELVKIIKILPQQKENIETTNSDYLNHDAGEFLSSVPEIGLIRKSGSYASDPVLRGFKYEQLNLIIDGATSTTNACPSRMDPAISQVNMNTIKEADIYKGPYFFRYGTSFGGTINFKTFAPAFSEKTNFGGRASSGYESNGNVFKNEAFGSLSNRKIVWDLFGSYQKGNRYKDGNGNEVPSKFERYNIGTKINYQWNEKNITSLQVNTNQGRNIEFAALKMDLIYDKTWMFQLQHNAKFQNSFLHHIDINSYASFVDHSMGTPNRMMVSDVQSKTYGARIEFMFKKNRLKFYTGLDFKNEATKNIGMTMPASMPMRDGSSWQDSQINQLGWFNEFNYGLRSGKLTASLRVDYNSANAKDLSQLFTNLYGDADSEDFNPNLSLGYSHFLNKKSQISLWLGRAQRSGSLTERFINRFTVGLDAYEILGNPHVKPEVNNQADLIYTFKNEKMYFQLDGFYAYLQDYISGVINPNVMPYAMASPGVRQIQNIDKAMKTGLEVNFNWQFSEKYKSELAAAYTYAKDLTTKNPLPEIAPFNVKWRWEANFNPVTLGLKYRYSGAQNRIDPNFGELKTKDFHLFDFDFRYRVFKNADVIGGIANLFNKAYSEHLSRTLATDSQQRILAPGRSFNLALSYSF